MGVLLVLNKKGGGVMLFVWLVFGLSIIGISFVFNVVVWVRDGVIVLVFKWVFLVEEWF